MPFNKAYLPVCFSRTRTNEYVARAHRFLEPLGVENSICVNMQNARVTKVSNPGMHVHGNEFSLVTVAEDVSVQAFTCFEYLCDVEADGFINHVHD